MTMQHDGLLYWPNGLGETPCSKQYEATSDAMCAIFNPSYNDGSLDDLSPADYNRYCTLENELANLQLAGHVGKSRKYA